MCEAILHFTALVKTVELNTGTQPRLAPLCRGAPPHPRVDTEARSGVLPKELSAKLTDLTSASSTDFASSHMQVILCFSPVGSVLRVRARKFPAVVNCTAINWFHEWPEDALVSVSARFLQETEGIQVRQHEPDRGSRP